MVDIFYNYYKENCGYYNNVFSEFKGKYFFLKWTPLLFLILFPLFSWKFRDSKLILSFILAYFILVCIILFLFNKNAKKVVVRKYKGISQYKGKWNSPRVNYQINHDDMLKLVTYSKEENLSFCLHLENMLSDVDVRIDKYKPKFPVLPATFGALIVAWYSAFVNSCYGSVTSLSQHVVPTILSAFAIIVLASTYLIYKQIVETISEAYLSKEYDTYMNFRSVLRDMQVYFDQNDMKIKKRTRCGRCISRK